MPFTLLVRTGETPLGDSLKLTFDGTQRVVIGRGASCDVRLPDPSVSHRHASVEASGSGYVLIDQESTNGTYVGGVRLAPRTSRMLRSGDLVRMGRVWLEVRLDEAPVTRDLGNATRELALALVAGAMRALGDDVVTRVSVVEGRDMGAALRLDEEGRAYVIGRGEGCDLPLADVDASREHIQVVRRASIVLVRDLGSKNGALAGEAPLPSDRDVVWRPTVMVRVGNTVLALEEPVGSALAELETAADEPLAPEDAPAQPPSSPQPSSQAGTAHMLVDVHEYGQEHGGPGVTVGRRKRPGWTGTDLLVMLAALSVLALSIAGLVWLLRG
jgi:pSer/pThr/pTyr-binding forkhead associated (FHA) protein